MPLAKFLMQSAMFLPWVFETFGARAETIFHGVCEGRESHFGDSREDIYTEYVFRVTEVFKGQAEGGVIRMRQRGGVVGEQGYFIPGAAQFSPNEEVLSFLTPREKDGFQWTVGLSQGKFTIQTDRVSQKKVLTRDLKGLTFAAQAEEARHARGFSGRGAETVFLDGFRNDLQGYVRRAQDRELELYDEDSGEIH